MKKQILYKLTLASSFLFPSIAVLSCSSAGYKYEEKDFKWNNIDWDKLRWFEVTVAPQGWNDGDTFKFLHEGFEDNPNTPPIILDEAKDKIRIELIDAPEMGRTVDGIYSQTTGKEFEIADASRIKANELAPAGSRVRVMYGGEASYDRIVGDVWYSSQNDGVYDKNFGAEMIKFGLVEPTFTNGDAILNLDYDLDPIYYSGWASYHNWNYSLERKIGMHKYDPFDVYGTRGPSVAGRKAMEPGSFIAQNPSKGYQFT